MARPSIQIDIPKLKALMRLKPTLEDTAAYFECTARTIERFVKKHFDISFVEFRDQNMVHTRLNLIRAAIQKAEKGDNTMLIFCLKSLCGWREKQPGEEAPAAIINNNIDVSDSDVELKVRIEQLKEGK